MKLVFVSNYFNHHQHAFSNEMYRLTKGEYRFISTEKIPQERLDLGYTEINEDYVVHYYENSEYCQELIETAEAVIFGAAPEELLKNRLKKGRIVFKYSERLYKQKAKWYTLLPRRVINHFRWERYDNLYLLSASAYAAKDYALTGNFIDKAYKWGYFPDTKRYDDIDALFDGKRENDTPLILWAGRFLDWKHPDAALRVAKRLRDDGLDFEMRIIGSGELEEMLHELLTKYYLEDKVHLLGSKKPEEVRSYMEKADIYLFTSDRNEGWGAVLNESMNSGCAVVANREIGSAPYLVDHNVNGLIYSNENELYQYVVQLIRNPAMREQLGRNAYKTITEVWNAEVAAQRFLQLAEQLLRKDQATLFQDGPCSKALLLSD